MRETVEADDSVNVAITLYDTGRIRLDYGVGNTGLTPSVGISRGLGADLLLVDTHDAEESLTLASTIEFELLGSQLPEGLSISPDGTLNGVPTTPGLYEFHLRVEDADHRYHTLLTSILVKPASLNPVATAPSHPTFATSLSVR